MVNGAFVLFSQRPNVFWLDPRYQNTGLVLKKLGSNFADLFWRFARSKDNFGKAFAQGPMEINLCKPKVRHGRSLKSSHDLVTANAAGTKFFKKFNRFLRGHGRKVRE
jgi:hypothetical protein